jgi:hypothetical protein
MSRAEQCRTAGHLNKSRLTNHDAAFSGPGFRSSPRSAPVFECDAVNVIKKGRALGQHSGGTGFTGRIKKPDLRFDAP